MRKGLLFCCCLLPRLLWPLLVYGQESGTVRERIEKYCLRLELDKASQLIEYEYNPNYQTYFSHHIAFYKALISENQGFRDEFSVVTNLAYATLEKRKPDPMRNVFLAEFLFERAVLNLKSKNYLSAANEIRKSYNLLTNNLKNYPNVIMARRLLGLYEISLTTVPSEFKGIVELLGYKGNVAEGIAKLRLAAQKSELMRTECEIILVYVQKHILADVEGAYKRIDSLHKTDPTNLLFTYLKANISIDKKLNNQAISLLHDAEKIQQNSSAISFPFLEYLLGKTYFFQQKYYESSGYYDKFLSNYKGKNIRIEVSYKKALCAELLGNRESARQQYLAVLELSETDLDEDSYSRKWAGYLSKRPLSETELTLLKTRNQFDGGYFVACQETLEMLISKIQQLNYDERCEVYYRIGRIFLEKKNYAKAKLYLNLAIQQNPTYNLWMKVYAHYYSGILMEKLADWHAARRFYRLALSFDNYDFQKGLEQKAKAGLERLKDLTYDVEKKSENNDTLKN